MNKRIRQLAEQAGLVPDTKWPTVDTRHQQKKRESLEKFAQSIVRDCAEIADMNCHLGIQTGFMMKRYFGLEDE